MEGHQMVKVFAGEVRVGDVVEHGKAYVEVLSVAQFIGNEKLNVQLAGVDEWATWDRDAPVEIFEFDKTLDSGNNSVQLTKKSFMNTIAVESVTFTVTRAQFTQMIAALYACQPSGDGGPGLDLVMNFAAQANIDTASDEFHALLQRYCQNVVQDAVDAGAAVWLEGGEG
jgi:hypothetical protein